MSSSHEPGTKIGKWFSIAAWIIVLIFLTVYFNDFLAEQRNPNSDVAGNDLENGNKEIILKRNRAGHYVATGYINHNAIEFLVDTGATNVAIPAHLAKKLRLQPQRIMNYHTANGVVQGYSTTIKELRLGGITLNDVPGGLNPGMKGDFVLLGMSFLKNLEFTQRGNKLIIRQYAQ